MADGTSAQEARVHSAVSRPLKILHIYRRFYPDYTGDGIYYMKLLPLVAARGIESEVLVLETNPGADAAAEASPGLPVHYLASESTPAGVRGLVAWLLRHIWRFDILHVHSHMDRWFISYVVARLCGKRVIFSCTLDDSPTQLLEGYQPRYRQIVSLLSRSINQFVVISPHLLRLSLQSTSRRRIRFIPQGVTLPRRPSLPADRLAARQALGLSPDDFLLLNVGSISRRKNVLFLVQALAEVARPDIKLILVGPVLEPDYMEEIEHFIAEHVPVNQVIFTGFTDTPERYYAAADVFVFSSLSEGFGNVFLEAMSWCLPMVTLFLPGIVDFIIDHGQTGFMASSLEQFVGHIDFLHVNRDLCTSMGIESRRFVEQNFDLHRIAAAYAELYRESSGPRGTRTELSLPDVRVQFSNFVSAGPGAVNLEPIDIPAAWKPILQVVIDTESEFEWDKGTWMDQGQVSSIGDLKSRISVFRNHGIAPALLIDYPIASRESSVRIIRELQDDGCEIGVHPHTWSTPPIVEPPDDWHSFAGNLGPKLQIAKLETLTRQIETIIGQRPVMFKAGRYGIGADTPLELERLGFVIDLSICPYYDFSPIGGPNFTRFTAEPAWFGPQHQLMSLPTTAGWLGSLRSSGAVAWTVTNSAGRAMGLDRVATRLNLIYPRRLSPEGNSFEQMKQLTRQLYNNGLRVFTLSLHSPTLRAGNTPYTRTLDDVDALLRDVDRYLRFFREELGGEFSTPAGIHRRLLAISPPPRAVQEPAYPA